MSAIQKIMIERGLWPAMERLRGNRVRALTEALRESETLSAEALHTLQSSRLTALLRHCAAHVPAYAALKTDDIEHDPYAVLASVPPLEKSTFQADPAQYLADNIDRASLIENRTGGSTGEPVHFYMTRPQVEAYEAARWRGLSWYGITPGSRSVMLWGSPIELDRVVRKRYERREKWLKNRVVLSAYELSPEKLPAQVRFLNRYQPEYLYGYASALTVFAELLEQSGLPLAVRLKAVVSTSETLTEEGRALLKRAFHCPVVNEYGARDAGILAYSCPCGNLHLTAENAVIEVLDPKTLEPLPAGQSGALAVTDLGNFAQPRLRYLLGDTGTLSTAPCACGRASPVLQSMDGREDAMLVGENGQLVHGNAVAQLIRRYDAVRQFRFVQHTPETVTLLLVMKDEDAALVHQIEDELRALLPHVELETQIVDRIEPSASGKARYTVRAFPLE